MRVEWEKNASRMGVERSEEWEWNHSTRILLIILLPFCGSATENYSHSTGDSTPFLLIVHLF